MLCGANREGIASNSLSLSPGDGRWAGARLGHTLSLGAEQAVNSSHRAGGSFETGAALLYLPGGLWAEWRRILGEGQAAVYEVYGHATESCSPVLPTEASGEWCIWDGELLDR